MIEEVWIPEIPWRSRLDSHSSRMELEPLFVPHGLWGEEPRWSPLEEKMLRRRDPDRAFFLASPEGSCCRAHKLKEIVGVKGKAEEGKAGRERG